jgi:hypothetical protein
MRSKVSVKRIGEIDGTHDLTFSTTPARLLIDISRLPDDACNVPAVVALQ